MLWRPVSPAEVSAATTTFIATNVFAATESVRTLGCIVRGADPAAVIDSSLSGLNNSSSASHSIPGLTGANLDTDSLVLGGVSSDGLGSYTTPAGWTLLETNNSSMLTGLYQRNTLTTAGVTVPATAITASVADTSIGITCAFNKA